MKLYLFDKSIDIDYILFLDIDGVINVFDKPGMSFEQESINTLNELYDKVKYKIVLSSSWKECWPIYYLQEMFKTIGIKAPLIATTNTYFNNNNERCSFNLDEIEHIKVEEYFSREYEISQWVRQYKVQHYIILDDYTMQDDELYKHSICTLKNGLRKEHLNDMIEKINKKEELI